MIDAFKYPFGAGLRMWPAPIHSQVDLWSDGEQSSEV